MCRDLGLQFDALAAQRKGDSDFWWEVFVGKDVFKLVHGLLLASAFRVSVLLGRQVHGLFF